MGFKEILDRIKKLEERKEAPDKVTLIYRIGGEEKRKVMDIHDATRIVMDQASGVLFCGDMKDSRIIGIECDESDGFLEALIDTEPIEEIENVIEV